MHPSEPSADTDMDSTPSMLQPLISDCGFLSQADGSAVLSQGDTTVMAAVYGPTEVRSNRELLDRAYVDLIYKPKTGLPVCTDKAMERTIKSTCESAILTAMHPRTSVNIILQEMQNSGSFLACCVNSACQALLDAAVPLKFLIAAVACVIDEDGQVIVNPTPAQELEAVVSMTFVFESKENKLLSCNSVGQCTDVQLQTALLTAKTAVAEVFTFYRESMRKKLCRE